MPKIQEEFKTRGGELSTSVFPEGVFSEMVLGWEGTLGDNGVFPGGGTFFEVLGSEAESDKGQSLPPSPLPVEESAESIQKGSEGGAEGGQKAEGLERAESSSAGSVASSHYQPPQGMYMPHQSSVQVPSGPHASFSLLDLGSFLHVDSDQSSVFYESAVSGDVAEAFDLPKEIPSLGYFPFENIGFLEGFFEHLTIFVERIHAIEELSSIVPPPEIENLPPIADPNAYVFDASLFKQGGEVVVEELLSTARVNGEHVFVLGNILSDALNPSLPQGDDNPVDHDPEGSSLHVHSVSGGTLLINGIGVALQAIEGDLPAGQIAGYAFTLGGETGSLMISTEGVLSLHTTSSNLFAALTEGEPAVFSFTYTNEDASGLVSNPATVSMTILGINDPPVAIDDSNHIDVPTQIGGGEEGGGGEEVAAALFIGFPPLTPQSVQGNILSNDFDPDGIFSPTDFSVVSVEGITFDNKYNGTWILSISDQAGGDEGHINGWGLSIGVDLGPGSAGAFFIANFDSITISDFTTVTSEIMTSITAPVTSISLTLFGFEHSYFADLVGTLQAPNGQIIELFNRTGGGLDAAGDVTFTDNAERTISSLDFSDSIVGSFKTDSGTALTDYVSSIMIKGDYGMLAIRPDGSYTYTLDSDNLNVNNLPVGQTLHDDFIYTMRDPDGLTSNATLDITIDGSNVPPIAEPNTYTFNADYFTPRIYELAPENVESQAFPQYSFFIGNILSDAVNPSLPRGDDNPVDHDPNGSRIGIHSITGATLVVNGVEIPLQEIENLPAEQAIRAAGGVTLSTEYSFTFDGHTGIVIVTGSGNLILQTDSFNLFGALLEGQNAVFHFTYTNEDASGLVSNPAEVTVNILGINDPPLAVVDSNEIEVPPQTNEGGGEGGGPVGLLLDSELVIPNSNPAAVSGNILANDLDPDHIFSPTDFSVVSVGDKAFQDTANGTWVLSITDRFFRDEGQINGWQLNLESGGTAYTFSNSSLITISDLTTTTSDITVSGVTGTLSHVSLTLFGLDHHFFSDLVGTLTGPNGQTIELFNSTGGGLRANGDVTFDDNALVNISDAGGPITGTFTTQSGEALNDFVSSFPTTMVVGGDYGTLIIHQDGSYDYILDVNNPDVISLPVGATTLEDFFPYIMKDPDGLTGSAGLDITIFGSNEPPIAAPNEYTYDASTFILNESPGANITYLGNILGDPFNPSLPASDSNPVDHDPEGTFLQVHSVINASLTINTGMA
jgi:VCBS repeat-containing protein